MTRSGTPTTGWVHARVDGYARIEEVQPLQSLRAELAWSPEAPRVARAVVRAWLEGVDRGGSRSSDLVLAASELVTRAVNGCPAAPTLECSYGPDGVWIAVGSAPMLDTPLDDQRDLSEVVLEAICDRWGRVDEPLGTSLWALVRA